MRSLSVKALLSVFVLVLALRIEAQTNPHTQIRWPANCNTANMVYTDSANTCIAAVVGPLVNPSTQINWPPSCNAPNMVYNFAANSCISTVVGITAGTTTNLPPGSQATVTQTGTYPNYVLNFGIPAGTPGGSLSYPGVTSDNNNGLAAVGGYSGSGAGTFGALIQGNRATIGGMPQGARFFGDSITAGNGSTASWIGFAPTSMGYAFRLEKAFGGVFTNDAQGGRQVLDQAVVMAQSVVPQLYGPTGVLMINTNDAGIYAGNVDLQTVTKRIDTFTHNFMAMPQGSITPAQGCTKSGTWTNDDTFGAGNAVSSTTNGNTLSCSTTPPAGSPGVVLACYIIADANTTSTFTLSIDGTARADPFESGTVWHGNGDNGAIILANGGTSAGPVCARFSGLSTGTAHTFLWTVTGTTGASAKVEPLMLMTVPAPSISNPNAMILGFPFPNASTTNYTYNAVYYAITQTIAQQAASDGLNVYWIDTQAAEAANTPISQILASPTTSVTPGTSGGWVSDNTNVSTGVSAVSYFQTGIPLVPVAASPACGQYAVNGSGTYTLNACDLNKPLRYVFTANCGAGTSNAVYAARCLTDTLHPNNMGHALILSTAESALANSGLLLRGASPDLTSSPNVAQPQTPKDWVTDNQLGLTQAGWNPGRAWVKSLGGVWGTTFVSGIGIVHIAPSNSAHSGWCYYPSTVSIPKTSTGLTCPVQIAINGGFYAGFSSAGNAMLYASPGGSLYLGLGGFGLVNVFTTAAWTPVTNATAGTNQSSPAHIMRAYTWTGTASATDDYIWKNTTSAGNQNTVLALTHSLNVCAPGPCSWSVDISGTTGINKLGTVGPVSITAAQTTATCSVSGTAIFSQPQTGATDKKVLISLQACNGTAGAGYTFPVAFVHTPGIFASSTVTAALVTSLTNSAVFITGTTSTGTIVLEDY
jgi:hypothetical protein